MARANVYLPDAVARRARGGLNVSSLTQDAVRRVLAARRTKAWLDFLPAGRRRPVRHEDAIVFGS